jgi:hypothetical protein
MKLKSETAVPPREPERPAKYDLPKDRKRPSGERSGEGADSIRPHLEHDRSLVPHGERRR